MNNVKVLFISGLMVFMVGFFLRVYTYPPEIHMADNVNVVIKTERENLNVIIPNKPQPREVKPIEDVYKGSIPVTVQDCKTRFKSHTAEYFVCVIDYIDIDTAINDICRIYGKSYCRILKDNRIYSYLKQYYKPALLTIADVEGKFIYKRGFYDKYDVSVFQINLRYYSILEMNRLTRYRYNIRSINDIIENEHIAGEVALRVWLINIVIHITKYNRFPKNLPEYISLYHNPSKVKRYYKYKVNKVVWKYINMFDENKEG